VQSEPQLGFRVTPVSLDDLRDLTSTRIDIETRATSKAPRRP
jgi:DNA-binding GntR family transcriptional regulator